MKGFSSGSSVLIVTVAVWGPAAVGAKVTLKVVDSPGPMRALKALVPLALLALAVVILQRSGFGRYIYVIGNNRDVARYSAVRVQRVKLLLYATSGLIAPKEMAQVLEQVLARASRLTLQGLRTLPPQAVVAPNAQTGAGAAQIYKHVVELELTGGYLDTLYFLQQLEALPWRFFWDHIEYTVEEHPRGRVRLRLYTLGLEEGWIGV